MPNRIKKIRQQLILDKLDFLFIDDPISLFYLTGLSVSVGILVIGQKEAKLFVDSRYIEMARKNTFCQVGYSTQENIQEFITHSIQNGSLTIGFDSATTTYLAYEKLQKLVNVIVSLHTRLVPITKPLKKLRAIKGSNEISLMKKSAQIIWEGYRYISSLLCEGITEKQLALELQMFCLKQGASGLSFEPIIAFGENSAMPHHHVTSRPLKKNDIVLIDIGAIADHYCSDMTRCVFFGAAHPELKNMYSIIKRAQTRALGICKPGVSIQQLEAAAKEVIYEEKMEPYYIHALGHGIGLEVHEYPSVSDKGIDKEVVLEEGMIITIEPGIYKEGLGGVRYEDTILITKEGYENFYPIGKE